MKSSSAEEKRLAQCQPFIESAIVLMQALRQGRSPALRYPIIQQILQYLVPVSVSPRYAELSVGLVHGSMVARYGNGQLMRQWRTRVSPDQKPIFYLGEPSVQRNSQRLFSYSDYLAQGYHESENYHTRNVAIVAVAAGLFNFKTDWSSFQRVFATIVGEEYGQHGYSVYQWILNYAHSETFTIGFFESLITVALCNRYRRERQGDWNHLSDEHKLLFISDLLKMRIVVITINHSKIIYERQFHSERDEIILIKKDYQYSNNNYYTFLAEKKLLANGEQKSEEEIKEARENIIRWCEEKQYPVLFLANFPTVLQGYILSFLTPQENALIRRVNHYCNRLNKDYILSGFFHAIANEDADKIAEKARRYLYAFAHLNFRAALALVYAVKEDLFKREFVDRSLTNDHYQVIEWIINDNQATLFQFIEAHPNFSFNYLDNYGLSPLFWAKLTERKVIGQRLIGRGAVLLPTRYSRDDKKFYYQEMINLTLFSTQLLNVLVQNMAGMMRIRFRIPPLIYLMKIGLSENINLIDPILSLRERGITRGLRQFRMMNGSLLLTFFHEYFPSGLLWKPLQESHHSREVMQFIVQQGFDKHFFTQPALRRMGKKILFSMVSSHPMYLEAVFAAYPDFCQRQLNDVPRVVLESKEEFDAISENTHDEDLNSLFHWACQKGNFNTIRFLLDRGGNIALVNDEGNTAVHLLVMNFKEFREDFTIYHAYLALIKQWLQSQPALFGVRNRYGETPFLCAAKAGNADVLALFNPDDTQFCNVQDKHNNTALHSALANKHFMAARVLLRFKDIDIKAKDRHDRMAIDILIGYSNEIEQPDYSVVTDIMVELLVRLDQSVYVIRDFPPRLCDLIVLQLVKQQQVRPSDLVSKTHPSHESWLHFAVRHTFHELLDYFLENDQAEVNHVNSAGYSALLDLVRDQRDAISKSNRENPLNENQLTVVRKLLKFKHLDINQGERVVEEKEVKQPTEEKNPLYCAASRGDYPLFQLLMADERLNLKKVGPLFLFLFWGRINTCYIKFFHITIPIPTPSSIYMPLTPTHERMLHDLLKRTDIILFPEEPLNMDQSLVDLFAKLSCHRMLTQYPAFQRLLFFMFCRNFKLQRSFLLHPQTIQILDEGITQQFVSEVWADKEFKQAWEAVSRYYETQAIWQASTALVNAKKAMREGNNQQAEIYLKQMRKLDPELLDLFVKQLLEQSFGETIYAYRYLSFSPAVMSTNDSFVLTGIAKYYADTDPLLSEGLFRRAKAKARTEQEKTAVMSNLSCLSHLAQVQNDDSLTRHFLPIIDELLRQLSPYGYQSTFLSLWNHPWSAMLKPLMDELKTVQRERMCSNISIKPLRRCLLRTYTDLVCRGVSEVRLMRPLRDALVKLTPTPLAEFKNNEAKRSSSPLRSAS